MENSKLSELLEEYPCRETQITTLNRYIGHPDEPFPDCIYIYGQTSTGKKSIVENFLWTSNVYSAFVNLIECYNNRLIFESILYQLSGYLTDDEKQNKCDSAMDFINELKNLCDTPCVIVLSYVERLRGNDLLLSVFLRLQEFTQMNICVIMISDIIFEQYFPISLKPPIKIHFPQYTKDELHVILSLFFEDDKSYVENEFGTVLNLNLDFYKQYLNIVLSVFCKSCRDLSEIRYMSRLNFKKYCEPLLTDPDLISDVGTLWRNIASNLKSSLNVLYLRINNIDNEKYNSDKNSACELELPFYAKYLLVAAYLASYNPTKEDKRLFMKHHGKRRNTKKRIQSKQKVSEKSNLQIGPKLFNFDRLLAIFYAILDEQVPLTSNLLVQLSSLVELKLLQAVGSDTDLSNRKYRCTVDFDFIETISKMVGFNIRKYLFDLQ